MAITHISEVEAASDFAGLMHRVRNGEEIVIKSDAQPEVLLRSVSARRSVSATIARAEVSSRTLGYAPVMDPDFAVDLEEIIRNRKPADRSAWDD